MRLKQLFPTWIGLLLWVMLIQTAAIAESHTVATVGGEPLTLELEVPPGKGPFPVIAWIHGGAWQAGSHKQMPGLTRDALERGFAVASLDYRLTSEAGKWGEEPVTWPAQLHDIKAGIRWLRANAKELKLDPNRIVVWGASAGGHLATMAGLTSGEPAFEGTVGNNLESSSEVALAVDFFGPTELFLMDQDVTTPPGSAIEHNAIDSPESRLVGSQEHGYSLGTIRAHAQDSAAPWPRLNAAVRSASPVHQVDSDDRVPLYIAHGKRDRLIAFTQAQRLQRACKEHGVPHQVRWYDKAGHGLPREAHLDVFVWITTTWTPDNPAID